MAHAKTKKQTPKYSVSALIFIIGIIAFTVIFAVLAFIMVGRPFMIKDYGDMKEVTLQNYKTQQSEEYYVYVYDSTAIRNTYIKEVIIEYANAARTNKKLPPIYVIDYSEGDNKAIVNSSNLNITVTATNIPVLVTIKNGTISTKYSTLSNISNQLTSDMATKK